MKLIDEVYSLNFNKLNKSVEKAYRERLLQGSLIMEENSEHHICVYTLPYYPPTKQILIGHHIKADKWIVPGGHIDGSEMIKQTAVREISEELGLAMDPSDISAPFFLSISHINNSKPPRKCLTHYDIWVYFSASSNDVVLDASEFHASKWVSLEEAKEMTTDFANKVALQKFATLIR